jgi:hypothetical protein
MLITAIREYWRRNNTEGRVDAPPLGNWGLARSWRKFCLRQPSHQPVTLIMGNPPSTGGRINTGDMSDAPLG